MPDYTFNMYGAADTMIAEKRDLLVDAAAAMIEANRTMYNAPDKVLPIIVKATEKPEDAVKFALGELTKNCVWGVNAGFDRARMEWTAKNNVEIGDIPAERNLKYDEVVDESIAAEAVVEINGCKL